MDNNYKIESIERQIEYLEKRLKRAEEQMATSRSEVSDLEMKIFNLKCFLGTAFAIATEIAVFGYILHLPARH
ncbi:MAG: hypothetical protein WCG15_10340 [Actinomycetes bacterium]